MQKFKRYFQPGARDLYRSHHTPNIVHFRAMLYESITDEHSVFVFLLGFKKNPHCYKIGVNVRLFKCISSKTETDALSFSFIDAGVLFADSNAD